MKRQAASLSEIVQLKFGMTAAAFGVLGAWCRYGLSVWNEGGSVFTFPWGTLACNLTGSFLLGLLFRLTERIKSIPGWVRTAVGTGFIGSFTTMSALSVEVVQRWSEGRELQALAYAVISFAGGWAFSWLGYSAVRLEKGGSRA